MRDRPGHAPSSALWQRFVANDKRRVVDLQQKALQHRLPHAIVDRLQKFAALEDIAADYAAIDREAALLELEREAVVRRVVGRALLDDVAEQGRAQDAALDDVLLVGSGSNDSAAPRAAVVGRDSLLDVEDLDLLEAAAGLFLELGESPATAAFAVLFRQLPLASSGCVVAGISRRDVVIQRAPAAPVAPRLVLRRLGFGFRCALFGPISSAPISRRSEGGLPTRQTGGVRRDQLVHGSWRPTAFGRARSEDHLIQLLDSMEQQRQLLVLLCEFRERCSELLNRRVAVE